MAKKKTRKKSAPRKSAKKSAAKKSPGKKGPSRKSPIKSARPSAKVSLPKPVFGASSRKEALIGEVEDYFAHIGVIAFTLTGPLAVGDTIHVKGHTTDLTQACGSMQMDHQAVTSAKKGDGIGVKVDARCRKGDKVFRVL